MLIPVSSPAPKNEATSRRLRNVIGRRIRRQLEERMDILTEIYHTDASAFLQGLQAAANKCGLLLSDSLQAACRGHFLITRNSRELTPENLQQCDEIKELFRFNISDKHCQLRNELGLAVKWVKSNV